KREGVAFVVDAATRAFPDCLVRVYAVDGRWLTADEARREPLAIAAANWAAAARLVARSFPDCILIDVGSTTTDIIPIAGGVPAALGRTDPERLCEGELVYTGALRTPAEAIAAHVPLGGKPTGVSAEGFALAGDVHVWRRQLASCAGGGGRAVARRRGRSGDGDLVTGETQVIHTVVKVGGGLLSKAGAFDLVTEALTAFSPRRRLVIVPGGGPFADAVRTM